MEKKTKKIIKGIGIGGAIGLGLYVGNEIRKEYNKTVAENNYLRDFIDTHDFYKKEAESRITMASGTKEKPVKDRLVSTTERAGNQLVTVITDPVSGFKCYSYEDIDEQSDLMTGQG
jgi:hypothetical protein